MQLLVNKLNQLGNSLGVSFGSSQTAQSIYGEFVDSLNRVINELTQENGTLKTTIEALNRELKRLREPAAEVQA
jgi:prefoldin subunit 5